MPCDNPLTPNQVEILLTILDTENLENPFTMEELSEGVEVDQNLLENYLNISAGKMKIIQVYLKKGVAPDVIAKTIGLSEVQVRYWIIQTKLQKTKVVHDGSCVCDLCSHCGHRKK